MLFKNIGLFSDSDKDDYFWTLKKFVPSSVTIEHICIDTDADNPIIAFRSSCHSNNFDCVILIDKLVDSYGSRKIVEKIIGEIKEFCKKVIILSLWDDTLGGELILVESRESTLNKCRRIVEII